MSFLAATSTMVWLVAGLVEGEEVSEGELVDGEVVEV